MGFSPTVAIIFFPIVAITYYLLPLKWQWAQLLVVSCIFYTLFIPKYLAVIFLVIALDYLVGIKLERQKNEKKKIALLLVGLFGNIGVLFVFKYLDFLFDIINSVTNFFHFRSHIGHLNLILPIGLSFHTFQAISYIVEIYKGNQKAERCFGIFALYIMFFPQLVAGPIERPQNLLHQFRQKHPFLLKNLRVGIPLVLWGMFEKFVIADRLSILVKPLFDTPKEYSCSSLLFGVYFFAIQIYGDFSGYSDIARGCARILGFNLVTNFNGPYFSKSISEFWRRWHMSLSTWFRDYLYLPLGGNAGPIWRRYLNLLIVFAICGLWHGAQWKFVVWGCIHAFFLIFGLFTKKARSNVAQRLGLNTRSALVCWPQRILTFNLVAFAWIFFRAQDLVRAITIVKGISTVLDFKGSLEFLILPEVLMALFFIAIFLILEGCNRRFGLFSKALNGSVLLRWGVCFGLIFVILAFGEFRAGDFIYFQF